MTKKEFQKLLEKYENGWCTPEEEQLLQNFLDSFQRPSDTVNWSKQAQNETGERMFNKINQRIVKSKASTFSMTKYWWSLLLVVLALGLGGYWVIQHFNENKKAPVKVEPGLYASLTTKENERKVLTLSDGTLITLNENSTLKYPKTFLPQGERKVELIGEAFFDVAKDTLRPFIAHSENIETIVLGTSFNIDARPESEQIEVVLVEGKVQVATSDKEALDILQSNEQLVYSKKNKTAQKSSFRGNLSYAWKEEVILFEKATVQEVVKVLSEKYNKVFQIENKETIESLLVYRVNTKKYKLPQVLKHISKVTDYQFIENADGSISVRSK